MRQRLGLAGALLGGPRVLILDEPANGLDPEGVHWLRGFLRTFADDGGTVLVSSHLLAEVAQTVDDVVIIARGRLVTQSPLAELTRRSRTAVRVRTPQPDELRSTLAARGIAAELPDRTRSSRSRPSPEAVGLAAAGARRRPLRDDGGARRPRGDVPRADHDRRRWPDARPDSRRAAEAAHDPHVLGQRRRRAGVRARWRRRSRYRGGQEPLDSADGISRVMAAASSGALLLLVIGILMTAGEFRHGTATSTFLISPDRRRVIGAKLAAAALVGAVVAARCPSLLTLAVALPWLATEGVDASAYTSEAVAALLGSVGATVLGAVVGVGFGAMVRNQTAAITVALVWTQVVEGILVGVRPRGRQVAARAAPRARWPACRRRTAACCRWAPPPCCSPPTGWPSRPRARRPSSGGTSRERAQCPHGRSRADPHRPRPRLYALGGIGTLRLDGFLVPERRPPRPAVAAGSSAGRGSGAAIMHATDEGGVVAGGSSRAAACAAAAPCAGAVASTPSVPPAAGASGTRCSTATASWPPSTARAGASAPSPSRSTT